MRAVASTRVADEDAARTAAGSRVRQRQLSGYLNEWRQGPELLGGFFTPPAGVEETDDAYEAGAG